MVASLSTQMMGPAATEGRDDAPRMANVARRRPTGRYVYDSSDEDSDEDPVSWRKVPSQAPARYTTEDFDSLDELEAHVDQSADLDAVRLANELDPWELWEASCRRKAWHPIRHRDEARRRSKSSVARSDDHSVQEIASLLSSFQLQQKENERIERESFNQRNSVLWDGIEQAIRDAERRAASEAEQLSNARKKQEQAELEAKQAREKELARIEAEKQAAAQEEARVKAKQKEDEQLAKEQKKFNAMRGGKHLWPVCKEEYKHWQAEMNIIKTEILPTIASNQAWRKQCFAAKRIITPKIGQLTNTKSEIQRITTAIHNVLYEAKNAPDQSARRYLYYWMMNHLVKCLIRQAEQEVAARQDTAYPLARVVLGLILLGHSALGDVFMARLVKKCPFVLGYVPEKPNDCDDTTYRKYLGFRTDQEESTQMYVSRLTGIAALYFACLQTSLTSIASCIELPPDTSLEKLSKDVPLMLQPSRLWIWQVRGCTPPVAQYWLFPSLWCTFLEIAGVAVQQRYKRQASKLSSLILDQGIRNQQLGPPNATKDNEILHAARVRLQLMLEAWRSTNSLVGYASQGRDME
ncbi:Nuclear pore complex nucleoporin component [Malassezia psittaci]|uniref:mRNA export factor GLE1 n=1 Tax=Malassezia psittaci TaxID=1821823 RepID=A0AAF0JDY3_9BASI|nr:Nuclear pore complex nucleoporin component [Malassezia psittaci]